MSLWARVFRERRAVIVPLVIVLAANIAMLLFVWQLQASVASAHAEALEARTVMATAKRDETLAAKAATTRVRAEEDMKRFHGQVLPQNFAVATRTANVWLQHAARDAGLEFRGAHFEIKESRESTLARASSTVTLVGRYADLRRFLAAMEEAKEFVILGSVELAQSDQAVQGPNDRLEIALDVSTYFPAEVSR